MGLLSGFESWSFDVDGALAPMDGIGEVESWEGNIHDAASCWKVIIVSEESEKMLWSKRVEKTGLEVSRERASVERGSQ